MRSENGTFADFRAQFVAGYKTRDETAAFGNLTLPLETAEFQIPHTAR